MAKKILITLLSCAFVLCGCAKSIPNPDDAKLPTATVGDAIRLEESPLYTIEQNSDNTYNYEVRDIWGKVLVSDKKLFRQPQIEQIAENLLKVSVQTGMGASTRCCTYADVVGRRVSDGFYYVLAETADKVVCVEYYEQYNIVVRDIFNRDVVSGGTVLEDVYAVEPVVECVVLDENRIRVVYLKGKTYTETELIVWI